MVSFSDECKAVYRLAKLDAGICDGGYSVLGAFYRIQVYMEDHRDQLDEAEYNEIYEELMLLKAIALDEDCMHRFDSAHMLLNFARKATISEMREMGSIICAGEMCAGEFFEYRTSVKKRWQNGYKLTEEMLLTASLTRKAKHKPRTFILR